MVNYIPDENKFKLSGPPVWWLKQLFDFDDSLVVIPSRQGFYYRLSQRRKLKLSDDIVNDALFKESDTKMMARYGLVPVTTILATANWSNPYLFEELRRRAPWRNGGAMKCADGLDDQDIERDQQIRKETDEHLTSVAKDAWGMYNKKIGLRTAMWSPTVKKAPKPVDPNRSAGIIIASR